MKSGRFADGFAIGIMDDDKKKTYDYQDFQELCSSEHLVLMKHITKHHYLILVRKAAEDFLLACAHELGVIMKEYGLPETLDDLKDVTKSNESDKEPRLKKLINVLRSSSEMARLERTVSYLHVFLNYCQKAEKVCCILRSFCIFAENFNYGENKS